MGADVVVVGQLGRDLVVRIDEGRVVERREMLGGKGANQAVGLAMRGATVALVGVVGADDVGARLLAQARVDGLDVTCVMRRGESALLIDLVEDGQRRLIEHVPAPALLTVDDVRAAGTLVAAADTVCLQLQQPLDALLQAARSALSSGARLVLDGAVDDADELLAAADVLRADAREARQLTGVEVHDEAAARDAAARLLAAGPSLVALEAGDGDLIAWPTGAAFLPHADVDVVDPTGGGDAFVAGLVTALRGGADPEQAGRAASAAAAAVVSRLGGRPA